MLRLGLQSSTAPKQALVLMNKQPIPDPDSATGTTLQPRAHGASTHARASLVELPAYGAPMRLLTGSYGQHCYQPHLHEEYTLSVIEQGDLRFSAEGRDHHAQRGEVVVIPPLAVHDGRNGGPQGFSYRVLYLHPQSLRAALGRDDLALSSGVHRDARCADALLRGHRSLQAWGGTRLGAEAALLSLLEDLVPGLQRDPVPGAESGPHGRAAGTGRAGGHPAIRRVAQRLDECPQDNPSLDELAMDSGLSRRHLTRLFRADVGLTVHQYQMQAKVRAAYSRLRSGATAAAAAAEVGFADQEHLTRWFWSVYGVSPRTSARMVSGCR